LGSLLLQRISKFFHKAGEYSPSSDANKTAPGGGVLGGELSQAVTLAGGVPVHPVARHFDHEGREGTQVDAQVDHVLESTSPDNGWEMGSGLDFADVGELQRSLLQSLLQLLLHDSIVLPLTASEKILGGPVGEEL